MIPILYTGDEKLFINNGIGRLSDATRCVVTEERNGIYELELDYPITGIHFEQIQRGRLIAATHDEKKDLQPFEIYKRSVPDLNGIVTFYAHHISYKLNGITVEPFTAGSAAQALEGIKTNSLNYNQFEFWTDKSTTGDFSVDEPKNARSLLAGEQGSILDVYGTGEYEFDRFTVKLYTRRGQDSDCEIRYGKNLTALNQEIDSSGTFNAVVPFWKDSEGNIVMLPEKMIIYEGVEPRIAYLTDHNLIVIRTETGEPIEVPYWEVDAAPMDLSDAFEEAPTEEQLRQAAKSRFESGEYWAPTENLTVDFVNLSNTEEYKDYAALQRVSLCDTVSVFYPQVGIAAVKQKVVRVVWNAILNRYDSIELGALQTTLGEQLKEGILQEVPTTSMMEEAIQYATNLIRGGLGGYVVMTPGPNGYPQEILIMDTPDKDTAVNVWRFNQGGLGHSSTGYEGPFSDIALTADGRINASMITTGILNANLIRAGVLQDVNGNVTWNLATGILNMKRGSINLGDGNFTVNDSGYMHAEEGTIGGFTIDYNSLYYQDDWDFTTFADYYIEYQTRISGKTYGTRLTWNGLEMLYKASASSWDDPPILAALYLDPDGSPINISIQANNSEIVAMGPGAPEFDVRKNAVVEKNLGVNGKLTVAGTKNRKVKTQNYSERLLSAYETPTPLFGDIGEAKLDEEGLCYVDIDDIFTETIAEKTEYQVFLQKEGEGDCWIAEKSPLYFAIKGTPNLKVAWEIKAKQRDYEALRLEPDDYGLDEYEEVADSILDITAYMREQEALLYG